MSAGNEKIKADGWRHLAVAGWLIAVALAALLLAACATPAVHDRVVVEKVPVAVKPLHPDQVPLPPAPLGPRPQSLSTAADVLAAKWCEAVSYFLRADPLLKLSAGMPQQALSPYPECERR